MADIAMLVAEEYERRVKNSRKIQRGAAAAAAAAANDEEIDEFFPRVSVSAKRVVDFQGSVANLMMKIKNGEEKVDLVKRVLEPRTEIGDAASKCFFSS